MTASEQHVFLRFMKKHKAWNKFKKLVKNHHCNLSLSKYFSKVCLLDVLTGAFFFNRTPQGQDYWYNLDDEFQKLR